MREQIINCIKVYGFAFLILFTAAIAFYYAFAPMPSYHNYTYAVYDGYVLRDYIIVCIYNKMIDMIPTNNSIIVGKNWNDSRPKETWC